MARPETQEEEFSRDVKPAVGAGVPRRTQAERSRETRQRVLKAAAACVAEEGFGATNLARIAARAGVTTGAIQHQFGNKNTALLSLVESGFNDMIAEVVKARTLNGDLPTRISTFIDALWHGYAGTQTQASIEVLLVMRSDPEFGDKALSFLAGVGEMIDRLWMGAFWDTELPRSVHVNSQRLIFTTLNGLALERSLLPAAPDVARDLARLKDQILEILQQRDLVTAEIGS